MEQERDIMYGRIVCNYREDKAEPNCTLLTMGGGGLVNYPDDFGTPTINLLTVKLLLNSIILTPMARFMTVDIKIFYLNTPLKWYKYLCLKVDDIPEDVREEYKLHGKATPYGLVYIEVCKGMYGLPQAVLLAQELLATRLAKHGHEQSKLTPGLWTHKNRPIQFWLVVDDFGVKYVGNKHAQHLKTILKQHYEISTNWTGKKYVRLTIDWNYNQSDMHISMPGYVQQALTWFQHPQPWKPQHQPHPHVQPKFRQK